MEGSLAAAFAELDNPNRQASWHFSVVKDGRVYQHVDTDNISWASGSQNANTRFWGIEHEGVVGQPLTPAQTAATTALMGWLLALKNLPAVRNSTLWEHREMTAYGSAPTACPSSRIPWAVIIKALKESEDMPRLVKKQGKNHVYVVTGAHLESVVSAARAAALGYDLAKVEELPTNHAIWSIDVLYEEVPSDA